MKTKNKEYYSRLFLLPMLLVILVFAGYQLYIKKFNKPLQGSFTLLGDPTFDDLLSSCFDLDIGEMTDTNEADICFGTSIGSTVFYMLSPVNNASAKTMGFTQPNLEDCKDSLDKFTQGAIPELEINSYICILTSQQKVSLLKIKTSRRISATGIELTIEFLTWK